MIIMAVRTTFSATEAAKAVNQLMRLDPTDTEALLEVVAEYFHPPSHHLDSEESDVDSDLDSEPDLDPDVTSPECAVPEVGLSSVMEDVANLQPSPMDEGALYKQKITTKYKQGNITYCKSVVRLAVHATKCI